jgi:plastocyanin
LTLASLAALSFVLAPASAARQSTGVIAGTITTQAPARPPIRVTIDPEVCGATVPDESVVVDAEGRVANAVVTVAGLHAPAPAEVVVANERCRFVPHVSLMRPGGTIRMTSRDAVLHTTHAASGGRAHFNVGLPIPGLTLSRSIDRPGVVQLTCSTHTWMRGYLHVTEELAAVSDARGAFRLDGVPAGAHTLRIWHETLAAPAVTALVKAGETTTVAVELLATSR